MLNFALLHFYCTLISLIPNPHLPSCLSPFFLSTFLVLQFSSPASPSLTFFLPALSISSSLPSYLLPYLHPPFKSLPHHHPLIPMFFLPTLLPPYHLLSLSSHLFFQSSSLTPFLPSRPPVCFCLTPRLSIFLPPSLPSFKKILKLVVQAGSCGLEESCSYTAKESGCQESLLSCTEHPKALYITTACH